MAVGTAFDQAMIAALVNRYGSAASGGVGFYELDNEPAAWNSTHRDVHASPVTAQELWTKSSATAAVVKSADPGAQVVGPSDWGWCAYHRDGDQQERLEHHREPQPVGVLR